LQNFQFIKFKVLLLFTRQSTLNMSYTCGNKYLIESEVGLKRYFCFKSCDLYNETKWKTLAHPPPTFSAFLITLRPDVGNSAVQYIVVGRTFALFSQKIINRMMYPS